MDIQVRWRPFQLNDGLPKGKGLHKMEMYHEKFGAARMAAMIPQMKEVGQTVGINFSYDGFIGNTFDSHRFIWKAREIGGSALQDKMVEALFEAYFEKEQSLGQPDVLEACADKVGMPKEVTQALLQDETLGKAQVEKEKHDFRTKWNCSGVPLFVIDNKYQLSGAQPVEEFDAIFQQLLLDKDNFLCGTWVWVKILDDASNVNDGMSDALQRD
eukprot:CAMPEP_0119017346 /NCGR_PEP_ID=MMETSP1176-20130426/16282_1 /TAXON_ID=265551 /ORGANISM="Synedropsis recta cf, Strain CCMP1620" /LENGTH=213 /DNA_ID=CAMNT_0006971043 /DNA_START=233 /DNA_END=872 /DNA_ORIENTATION=+